MTVFDRWLANVSPDAEYPSIGLPGTGSDYAPFAHLSGLSILDMHFTNTRPISIYSTYHTGYDNFEYASKFIDPGFKGIDNRKFEIDL